MLSVTPHAHCCLQFKEVSGPILRFGINATLTLCLSSVSRKEANIERVERGSHMKKLPPSGGIGVRRRKNEKKPSFPVLKMAGISGVEPESRA